MKIITPGKVDGYPRHRVCGECGCVFEYDLVDVGWEPGRFGAQSFVACPTCGERLPDLNTGGKP